MICYKDRTFCRSEVPCTNKDCWRFFGEEEEKAALAWGQSMGLSYGPVAFSDWSKTCPDYMPEDSVGYTKDV